MPGLQGQQRSALVDVIADLFDDFRSLCDFIVLKIDVRLTRWVTDTGDGMAVIALATVEHFEEQGTLPDLIVQLWLKKPSEDRLTRLAGDLGIALKEAPPAPAGTLEGLGAVARDARTRGTMLAYRGDIRDLCAVTAKLGALKFLHDKIDHLRRTVCTALPSIIDRLQAPETRDLLRGNRSLLDGLVRDITGEVADAQLGENDVPWVNESLLPAQAAMAEAAQRWPLAPPLAAAQRFLADVTGAKLADINGQIKGRAEALAALKFAERMASLQASVDPSLASDDERSKLNDEIARIVAAIANLINLVVEHDRWQRIKDYNAMLDTMMTRPVGESRYSWAPLDQLLGVVSANPIYPPPDALLAARAAVAALFADTTLDQTQPSALLGDAVYTLRTFDEDQFYTVDKNLLRECEFIGQYGDRLQTVLEVLDG